MSVGPIHLEIADQEARKHWGACARSCAWVASAFIVLVGLALFLVAIREHYDTPLTPTEIDRLKRQLDADPLNPGIKDAIRDIDQRMRKTYFGRRAFFVHGTWLLIGGVIVLTLSVKFARDLEAAPYAPVGPVPLPPRFSRPMKLGIAGIGAVFAGFFLAMSAPQHRGVAFEALVKRAHSLSGQGPGPSTKSVQPAGSIAAAASEEEMKKNWPNFRGAGALGLGAGDYPTEWSAESGKNIAWKAAIPQGGKSSAIVWDDRVFVTGGGEEKREVYCFDAGSGKLLWTVVVGKTGPQGLEINKDTTWSPSTPSTDGRRVFAIFPTGDLAAINFDGTPAWSKTLGPLKTQYGHAASLLCWSGILYVQLDQGEERDSLSAVWAYDSATGKELWQAKRPVTNSWSTPMIAPAAGGPQLVLLGNPWICAYDPKTGAELWKVKGLGSEVAPSPAFFDNAVIVAVKGADYYLIGTDGKGDVTKSHAKKIETDALPDVVSPVVVGGKVLLVEGKIFLLADAKAGKTVWEEESEEEINSSPVAIGQRVYLADRKGTTRVFDVAEQYKEISKSPLGQEICATPAFVNGRIYIRGAKELFCIGQGGQAGQGGGK